MTSYDAPAAFFDNAETHNACAHLRDATINSPETAEKAIKEALDIAGIDSIDIVIGRAINIDSVHSAVYGRMDADHVDPDLKSELYFAMQHFVAADDFPEFVSDVQ